MAWPGNFDNAFIHHPTGRSLGRKLVTALSGYLLKMPKMRPNLSFHVSKNSTNLTNSTKSRVLFCKKNHILFVHVCSRACACIWVWWWSFVCGWRSELVRRHARFVRLRLCICLFLYLSASTTPLLAAYFFGACSQHGNTRLKIWAEHWFGHKFKWKTSEKLITITSASLLY